MKYFAIAFLLLVSPLIAAQNPETVSLKIEKAYVPIGFDDNDRAQVTVVGILPDTCYKAGPYEVKVDDAKKTIRIEQKAYLYKGVCLTVTLPFSQVVELGIVKNGNYSIIDEKDGKEIGKLGVAQAKTQAPDDYVYAPLSEANLVVGADKSKNLMLSGSFTSRCQAIQQVLVSYYPDVVVVQPIIQFKKADEECKFERVAFEQKVALKADIPKAFLLHVRSMDGQAINKIVELQ